MNLDTYHKAYRLIKKMLYWNFLSVSLVFIFVKLEDLYLWDFLGNHFGFDFFYEIHNICGDILLPLLSITFMILLILTVIFPGLYHLSHWVKPRS
jgi:hypothetical protein